MAEPGSVESDVEAWLATIDASGGTELQAMPTATIVPSGRRDEDKP